MPPPTKPVTPALNDDAFNEQVLANITYIPLVADYLEDLAVLADGGTYQVQSSPTDGTADRLMKVGAFGLGVVADGPNYDLSTNDRLGKTVFSSTLLSTPTGYSANDRGWYQQFGTPGSTQRRGMLYDFDSLDIWTVRATPGTWAKLFSQANIIGTVSQTAGVPTGALIEKGSNANGFYRKFPCGLYECWHTKAASVGAATTWTFPGGAFFEAPVVTGNAVATVLSGVTLDAAPTTTAATYSARDKADARRADTVHLRATGRWSNLV